MGEGFWRSPRGANMNDLDASNGCCRLVDASLRVVGQLDLPRGKPGHGDLRPAAWASRRGTVVRVDDQGIAARVRFRAVGW